MLQVKSKKRELALIEELRTVYGYLFLGAARRNERSSMLFKRQGKKLKLTPSVNMRLAVPAHSALGRQVAAAYRTSAPTAFRSTSPTVTSTSAYP